MQFLRVKSNSQMKTKKDQAKKKIELTLESRKRLEVAIENKKIKKSRVAADLDYAPTTINNWISGKVTSPTREKITAVCHYLGISLEWLLTGGTDKVEENNTTEDKPFGEDWIKEKMEMLVVKADAKTYQIQDLHSNMLLLKKELSEIKSILSLLSKQIEALPYILKGEEPPSKKRKSKK